MHCEDNSCFLNHGPVAEDTPHDLPHVCYDVEKHEVLAVEDGDDDQEHSKHQTDEEHQCLYGHACRHTQSAGIQNVKLIHALA